MYTFGSIAFDLATGNVAGASGDIVSELLCAKFGKTICANIVNKAKGLFARLLRGIDVKRLVLGAVPSSSALGKNMELIGIYRPNGTQAHHIVGSAYDEGKKAQNILKGFNIDLNSPANGVFLAGCHNGTLPGAVHCGNHTKEYAQFVLKSLENARTREDALMALDRLREEMLIGNLVLNARGINP